MNNKLRKLLGGLSATALLMAGSLPLMGEDKAANGGTKKDKQAAVKENKGSKTCGGDKKEHKERTDASKTDREKTADKTKSKAKT